MKSKKLNKWTQKFSVNIGVASKMLQESSTLLTLNLEQWNFQLLCESFIEKGSQKKNSIGITTNILKTKNWSIQFNVGLKWRLYYDHEHNI